MRKRISITIKEDLLRRVDSTIGSFGRNRSNAIEKILEEKFMNGKAEAAVLAGDASCLTQFEGSPIISRTLLNLISAGIGKVSIATTQDVAPELKKALVRESDGTAFDFIEQKERIGTAATLRKLKGRFIAPFILVYGDNYFDFDVLDVLAFHKESGATVTMALTTSKTPSDFGVVELQGKKVVRFIEKPEEAESYLVSTGVFAIDPSIFSEIPEKAKSLEKDVFPKLLEKGKLSGCVVSGKWVPLPSQENK